MEGYRVLLVDDEEDVIHVMQKKVNWENLGFSVIGYAKNGVQALEIAEEEMPDVVITDIKMPYMDGLELSRRLRKEFPDLRILLFTGFDEFEYAKEAVHLEVSEYILKPISSIELTKTLTELKKNMDEERSARQNVRMLQEFYMESLPVIQSNFYIMLIEGRIPEDSFDKYRADYQVAESLGGYCFCIFHVSSHHIPEGMHPSVLQLSVWKYITDEMKQKWDADFFTYRGDIAMLVRMPSAEDVTRLTDDCNRIVRSAGRVLGAVVTAGIGGPVEDLKDLQTSYLGAREAVSYRVLYGTGRAINIREAAPEEKANYEISSEGDFHQFFTAIRMGKKDVVTEASDAVIDKIIRLSSTVKQYRMEVSNLLAALYRFARGNEISMEEILTQSGLTEDPFLQLIELDAESLREWLKGTALSMMDAMSRLRSSNSLSYVEGAKNYVRDHYSEADLSLESVCKALGVSESYFSSIFKKETGEAFVSFLTGYRMEKAKDLLLLTNDKNYIIGKKVGYEDPNYFSYVFKKAFGVSPSRFRQKQVEDAK